MVGSSISSKVSSETAENENKHNQLTKENQVHQRPLLLNKWQKKPTSMYHPTILSHLDIYELLSKIVSPYERQLAEAMVHYHLEHSEMGLTNGDDDEYRLANALTQLADITHYRLLGKPENLDSSLTLTELAKLAHEHYFEKSEYISAFFRRCNMIKHKLIPIRTTPLRPNSAAVVNNFLSRVLLAQEMK